MIQSHYCGGTVLNPSENPSENPGQRSSIVGKFRAALLYVFDHPMLCLSTFLFVRSKGCTEKCLRVRSWDLKKYEIIGPFNQDFNAVKLAACAYSTEQEITIIGTMLTRVVQHDRDFM